MTDSAVIEREADPPAAGRPLAVAGASRPTSGVDHSRRRFIIAVTVGTAIIVPLVLWLLWDLWTGSVNPLRGVPYDDFYDLQARAMFQGHLYLPNGRMGIEAFVHDGRQYTYFGIFPSIIRMPILLVTNSFDGQLTAPSILFAWIFTAVTSALMLWRLRFLMRGEALLGRAEAASYGLLMATIMGGSVILYLTATPFIYNEDFAWSIPLTVGSLFALLGVLEKPTRGRVLASGILVLCANLDRSPPGWACSIAALMVAAWFGLGRSQVANRRWAIPMVLVGLVPFVISCAVTYAKFGIPVGLPMADQAWTAVNAHRRYFLAANGGKAFSFAFLPSTLWAYFQPFGIRLSGLFPFILPPGKPASWIGAVMDQSYPTASFTASSPLLFLLGLWGTITAFRPNGIGKVMLTRIILIGGAAGAAGVLLWGYMSQRYLGDLMPFFIIAGGIGLIDVWRRLENRPRRARGTVLGVTVVVAVYCVAANLAVAAFPIAPWTNTQIVNYVTAEKGLSLTSLRSTVLHGNALPYWAPAGQLFAMNNCSGLYLSTGNNMTDVPGQQIEHYTWVPVEQSPSFTQRIGFTFNQPVSDLNHPVTLMTYGASRLVLARDDPGWVQVQLLNSGTSISWPPPTSWSFKVTSALLHQRLFISVTTDTNLSSMVVNWYTNEKMLNHYIAGHGPAVVTPTPTSPGSALPPVTVVHLPIPCHHEHEPVPQSPAGPLSGETDSGTGLFSCVLDEHPRFHLDALRWFACLTEVAGVHPGELVAHVVGDAHSDVLDFLRGKGVSVVEVERFDRRSPHCNKISGALRLAEEETGRNRRPLRHRPGGTGGPPNHRAPRRDRSAPNRSMPPFPPYVSCSRCLPWPGCPPPAPSSWRGARTIRRRRETTTGVSISSPDRCCPDWPRPGPSGPGGCSTGSNSSVSGGSISIRWPWLSPCGPRASTPRPSTSGGTPRPMTPVVFEPTPPSRPSSTTTRNWTGPVCSSPRPAHRSTSASP